MIPAVVRLAIIGSLVGIFFVIERLIPLRHSRAELLGRLLVNLAFSGVAFVVVAVLVRLAALLTMHGTGQKSFGLIHLVTLPAVAQFIIAFLLMDLSFYWWHKLNHRRDIRRRRIITLSAPCSCRSESSAHTGGTLTAG